MSSAPPPVPPTYGYVPGQPSTASPKEQLRQQQRAAAAQAGYMRYQAKMARRGFRLQRRAFHRSIVGPLLLLVLGVLLLFAQTGHLDWSHLLAWYSHWWPAILIGIGLVLVLEWAFDQRRDRFGPANPRVLGPGVGILLLMLACIGWSLGWFTDETRRTAYGFLDNADLQRFLSQEYEWDDSTQVPLPSGMPVVIRNPRGNVTVSGSSTDGQVHLTLQKKVYAWQQSSANEVRRQLEPKFSRADGSLVLEVPAVGAAEADLTVALPAKTGVTVHSERGDTSLSGIQGAVNVVSKGGDVTFDAIRGSIIARVNKDGATVSGHDLAGPVKVQGRTGDLNFSDVDGALTLEGDFFGSTHLEHITDPVLFQTSRTHFEVAQLTGTLDLDGGPDFQATGLTGPLVLTTKNRNISLDKVTGSVQITNRNGSIDMSLAAPFGPVQITNQRGAVDISLPEKAGFRLWAETRNGDIENDFGFSPQEDGNTHSLSGSVAGGGAEVRINTSDGSITVRKNATSSDNSSPPAKSSDSQEPEPKTRHLKGHMPALQQM